MSSNRLNDEQVSALIEHLGCRLFFVFSLFFYSRKFGKQHLEIKWPPSVQELGILTMHGACVNTTLLAIRDLDDFFTLPTRNTRPDDVKASHLGYHESLNFLTKTERDHINKIIMHTTFYGIQNSEISWDIGELASKCISQTLHFLKWVQTNYQPNEKPKIWAVASFQTRQIEMVLTYAKSVNKR